MHWCYKRIQSNTRYISHTDIMLFTIFVHWRCVEQQRHINRVYDIYETIYAREMMFFRGLFRHMKGGTTLLTTSAHHYRTTIRGVIEGNESRILLKFDAAVARDIVRQWRCTRYQPAHPTGQDRNVGLTASVEAGNEPIDSRVRIIAYFCPRLGDDGQYIHSAAFLNPARSWVRE